MRDIHCFNLALLAKQGWRILTQPDSLLARIYAARYLKQSSFLEAEVKGAASWGWRSIMAGIEVLKNGMRWSIGRESEVSI